tara:strand:+ start:674 stop:919 length:246 start_codon:yes stop_codon:yes gene_type:complete
MIGIIIVCVLALMVALIIWFHAKLSGKARTLMEPWASENGLELLHVESRWFRQSPFFWSSKSQWVYYVTLQVQGQTKTAYI